jgi:hypothetical protein
LPFALVDLLRPPTTEAARATAPETAPVALLATLRTTRRATEGFFSADDLLAAARFAGFVAALVVVMGFTLFGAALPNVFLESFERAETADPAPDFAWVALLFLGAAFLAVVAMGPLLMS